MGSYGRRLRERIFRWIPHQCLAHLNGVISNVGKLVRDQIADGIIRNGAYRGRIEIKLEPETSFAAMCRDPSIAAVRSLVQLSAIPKHPNHWRLLDARVARS